MRILSALTILIVSICMTNVRSAERTRSWAGRAIEMGAAVSRFRLAANRSTVSKSSRSEIGSSLTSTSPARLEASCSVLSVMSITCCAVSIIRPASSWYLSLPSGPKTPLFRASAKSTSVVIGERIGREDLLEHPDIAAPTTLVPTELFEEIEGSYGAYLAGKSKTEQSALSGLPLSLRYAPS